MTKARSNATAEAAKGDLRVGNGTNLSGILAVGNNGETIVADSSTATGLRYNPQNALANPIINGGMDIWQRGTSTSTSQAFAADRWQAYLGSGTGTWSRQSVSDSTNLPNIQYCLRVQRNSGQTTTSILYAWSNLETVNCIPFAGKTVTFSYYARAGANYSSASNALGITIRRGTGTDQNAWLAGYTGNTETAATATLTTTWQRFVVNFTFPSNMTEFSPAFYYTPSGTAGANDYFEVTGVQVDLGTYTASTAPAFRRSGGTIQGELAACQRYFWRAVNGTGAYVAMGQNYATTNGLGIIQYPVTMRVGPSVTVSNATHFSQTDSTAGSRQLSAFSADSFTNTSARLATTCGAFMTAGNATLINSTNASATLDFGAEL